MGDCLFCKIASGAIPAAVLEQDGHIMAFLDVHPCAPGHTLVIPKTHAPSLAELPEAEVGPLFDGVRRMAQKLEKSLSPQGLTIGINQGEVSGQSVPHLHVHLMPRFEGDGGGSIHSVVQNPGAESIEEMVEKINRNS